MNFLKKYIPIILLICVFLVVSVSAKFISDYRKEQKKIIYKTVDEKKFFQCKLFESQTLFFLNRSPKNRDAGTYSDTTFVQMSKSDKGSGKPSFNSVRTVVETDFLEFWDKRYLRDEGSYRRPTAKLNRLTGDYYSLKKGKRHSCYTSRCNEEFKEEDYQILKCEEINEDLFYFHFNALKAQFEIERKF